MSSSAADVHDRAAALLERGQRGEHGEDRSEDVHGELRSDRVLSRLLDGARMEDARVVHQDVEPPRFADDALHGSLDLARVRNVCEQPVDVWVTSPRGLLRVLSADEPEYPRARAAERGRGALSDTAVGTGDEDHLFIERRCHCRPPRRSIDGCQLRRDSAGPVGLRQTRHEAQVRVPLLVRTTRRMTLTEAGQRYYDHCVRILREVEDAQAIGDAGVVRGTLTISAPVTFGIACVTPHLPSLLAKHPALLVDLRLEDRFVDLVAEAVDVAIRVGIPPESNTIIAHRLTAYRRVLVGSPTYLRQRGEPKRPEDLSEHDAVSEARDSGARVTWILRRSDQERRAQPVVRLRCNARYAILEAALRHVGLALLPENVSRSLAPPAARLTLSSLSKRPGRWAHMVSSQRGQGLHG
jgi:DNA-binding transcriptional LysR family regulator